MSDFNPAKPPAGTSMIAVNTHNKTSTVEEWNLQLEHQFGSNNVVNIAYVGTTGTNLSTYYPYNINQFVSGIQNFPTLGSINYNNYNGISNYNGLQLHVEHRMTTGLTATGSYAWSHTLDDSPGAFQGQSAALYYDPMAGYGNSSQDQRQVFSSSILYLLPFGRGQQFGGSASVPMDWLIGGWQTSLTALVQSGSPTDLSTGTDAPGNRPDLIVVHQVSQEHLGPLVRSDLVRQSSRGHRQRLGRHHLYTPGNPAPQPGLWARIPCGEFQSAEEPPHH